MIRTYLSRAQINADRVAALLVTLAPLVYFFPALRGQIIISPDDGVIFNVPLRVAAANLIRTGDIPLWNPYIFSGMPLHASAQAGLLFPLNWFYLIATPPVATNLMMLATYMVAALGAFLFARRTGANLTGAIATSLIWQFSAFLVEQVGHTNILQTAAMLPWVLWALEGYVGGYLATGSRRRGLLLAALVAIQIFAGHQQTSAYALLLAGVYAVVLVRAARMARSAYLSPLAMLALGLSLAAVQILPTIELLRNSMRATASYDFFSSFSMPPRFALTLFAPYLFGGGNGRLFRAPYVGPTFFGEYVAYVGLLTIMLAVVAVVLKQDVRTRFWAVVFVVCFVLAFGRFLPFHLYAVVYYIPVLNLFRVPARHLMEVEFALAVLAGRGITILASARNHVTLTQRRSATVVIAALAVFLLTFLSVTWWRPGEFRLGRQVPLTLLRAPELFLPIVMAALSAAALWAFTRSNRRRAGFWLIAVLLCDLSIYGQGSGWRTSSPTSESELWREPAAVKLLRDREGTREGAYRILTADQRFDPSVSVPPPVNPGDWLLSLQPDIYMMHGIENAAGYDGFGLARYSSLAGDMKIWGELPDPERMLRGDTREIDLLNVRYLLTRPMAQVGVTTPSSSAPSNPAKPGSGSPTTVAQLEYPAAVQDFSGSKFAAQDLTPSRLDRNSKIGFAVPPVEVDRLALVTNLSWSIEVPDNTTVARVKLFSESGRPFSFDLRTGEHTAEWAHDRSDIKAKMKHRRPPLATSYKVDDGSASYEAHSYVAAFPLPERARITGGEISLVPLRLAPDLLLDVLRISLIDQAGGKSFPVRREWLAKESIRAPVATAATAATPSPDPRLPVGPGDSGGTTPGATTKEANERWHRVSHLGRVVVFENKRVLPRAWLTTETAVLKEPEMLEVIRTATLPNGQTWDPARVALLEAPTEFTSVPSESAGNVQVTSHEPNRITLKTNSSVPSVLVLSENHYPGWRAYVDGNPVETLRVNYNLRGLTLAAGDHDVEFLYRPKSVLFGGVISILTLLGLVIWWRREKSLEA